MNCVNVENEMTAKEGKGKVRHALWGATLLLLLLGLPLLKHLSTKRSQFNNFHSAHRWLFIVLDFIYYLFVCLESARVGGQIERAREKEEDGGVEESLLERKRRA